MKITPRNFWQFARRPAWSLDMLIRQPPIMPSLVGMKKVESDRKAMQSVGGRNYDPAFDLAALARIRDRWPRKLIVKGVVHPGDVDAIVALGADALVVSNHGGRQLDTGVATLDALPGIVAAARGRVPVLLDGGVRRGSDVFKALALGAAGVMTGRATLYGVLAGGLDGVQRALHVLRDELTRTMQLCGTPALADITRDILMLPQGAAAWAPYGAHAGCTHEAPGDGQASREERACDEQNRRGPDAALPHAKELQ